MNHNGYGLNYWSTLNNPEHKNTNWRVAKEKKKQKPKKKKQKKNKQQTKTKTNQQTNKQTNKQNPYSLTTSCIIQLVKNYIMFL